MLWSYVKRNKWKSTLGVAASTGALVYTFREPIMEYVKPVTERLVAYAMEQQMTQMKIQGRQEARKNHFKHIGAATYASINEFLPIILKRVKTTLSVKQVVEALKSTKTQDQSTPELKKQVVRVQAELYRDIIASRLAEYAACMYASGLLITTFRLYLIVLARHKLDRQPPLPKENEKSKKKGTDPLDLIESAKRFGLNDLRSSATREALHAHAWNVVLKSLESIIMATKQASSDCLADIGWKHLTYVNAEEMTKLMDNVLGHTHELLFSPRLGHEGYALTLATSELEHPDEACTVVIKEANCMLNSPVFLDVVASATGSVAEVYSEKLQENIALSIPRDGPCQVNREMLSAFLNEVAGVAELVPSADDLEANIVAEAVNDLENDTKETKEQNEIDTTSVPSCKRDQLCARLMHNKGEMIQKLAGFGPKMAARKESQAFIQQCIQVIRDGPEDVLVDIEEVTEVLEAVLDDVSNRTMLLTAVGKTGLGKTQTSMCKINAKLAGAEHPLDKVMGEESLDHFLGGVFEDVVDVVHDRQSNGATDDENGEEAMMMQQLQGLMSGMGGDGVAGEDAGGMNMEAMNAQMVQLMGGAGGGGGDGGGGGAGQGGPSMEELSNIFAQMGQPPPTKEDMAEMDKLMQNMMGGGGSGGLGGAGMPMLPGIGNPSDMNKMMQELEQDPKAMEEMMKAMQSPEIQQMAQMFAGQMSGQGGNTPLGEMD